MLVVSPVAIELVIPTPTLALVLTLGADMGDLVQEQQRCRGLGRGLLHPPPDESLRRPLILTLTLHPHLCVPLRQHLHVLRLLLHGPVSCIVTCTQSL